MTQLPTPLRHKKVPEITALFWGIKLLTTAMGEIVSDYLVTKFDPVLSVCIAATLLMVVFCVQFFSRTFNEWRYWATASMIAVVGTMAADVAHIVLGVPYIVSVVCFALLLAGVFITWYRTEHTLSIHTVKTRRTEGFYWATIAATFALGTAAGDFTASTLHLGYLVSAVVFGICICIPAVVYLLTKRHEIIWFWIAYILTRPLGASIADWLGKPKSIGGLGIGDGLVSLILLVAVGSLVAVSRYRKVQQ